MGVFNLMAFPGGGAYGAFQAAILNDLDEAALARVNGVAGTSIGSVMALAVALNKTRDVRAFFLEQVRNIFRGYGWRHLLAYPMPRYGDRALNDALKLLFGMAKLGDAAVPAWVVAAHASGRPKVFFSGDGGDEHVPMWEVARASCAAPTFFERWNGKSDGGLVANNPVMVGVAGAMCELGVNHLEIRALKIGTGQERLVDEEWRDGERKRGPRTYLGSVLFAHRAHMDGAVDSMHDYFARCVVDPLHYEAVDFVPKFDGNMDDARVARRILKDHGAEIEDGVKRTHEWLMKV